jgi:acetylornithine/succinyldiaminopimelate/putrescine aminotransferase
MKEYLFRDVKPYALEVVDSNGSYLINKSGDKYLDLLAGWCVGNSGWKNAKILNHIKKFNGPTYVMMDFQYARWEVLAKKFVNLMPTDNYVCFKATGGTEAVEIAMKIARAHTKRKKFIAFKEAYHGQSLAALSLVKISEHEKHFGKLFEDFLQVTTTDWDKTTKEVVELISKGDIAAFISEPIILNLGVVIPPKSFFDEISKACKKNRTLLIMDEVASGFGRTGKMFGFEHFDIIPDIVTIAKGTSGGYGGIGATIAKDEIAKSMHFEFSNYSTYGWHPLSVEAAIANIDYIQQNNLIEKSKKSGKYLMDKLSSFSSPEGKGLCIGVPCKNKNIVMDCFSDKLIVGYYFDRILICPSLEISENEIDGAISIIKRHFK